MINPGLESKAVLITGGNHGIGAATAKAFAAQGAAVFITYLRIPVRPEVKTALEAGLITGPGEILYEAGRAQTADAVVESIRIRHGQAEAWEADLRSLAAPSELFDRAEAAFGPVNVLINNAAGWLPDTFLVGDGLTTISMQSFEANFDPSTRATALLMAEFARRHIDRKASWGRIVNISTDSARCFPTEVSYGASKAAIESYSRSAARELGRYGITVNVIAPGPVQTDWLSPEQEAQQIAQIPLGRVGQPEDIADAAIFLSSEQARWITGQVLVVAGGHSM